LVKGLVIVVGGCGLLVGYIFLCAYVMHLTEFGIAAEVCSEFMNILCIAMGFVNGVFIIAIGATICITAFGIYQGAKWLYQTCREQCHLAQQTEPSERQQLFTQ
jgi:hypothetical protein